MHLADLLGTLPDSAAWPYLRLGGLPGAFCGVALIPLRRIYPGRGELAPRHPGFAILVALAIEANEDPHPCGRSRV